MINNSIFYFGGEYEEEEGSDDFESPIQRIDLENETIVEDGVEVIGNHDFRSFFPKLFFSFLTCPASEF